VKVLAVVPRFDEVTQYTSIWYERLKRVIKDKVELSELSEESATREAFEDVLEEVEPEAIVFEDHGSESCLYAQGGRDCVLDLKNVGKVAGKVIYTVACLSARRLGAKAYAYGCVYVGYAEVFAFTVKDEQYFCEAANSGFIAYVEGERDWRKIKAIMIEAFDRAIAAVEDPWCRIWLRWDRDALRVYAPGVDQPEARCLLRRIAVRLLGPRIGWRISRIHAFGWISFLVGYGVTLHAVASELYCKGGYAEIFKPQGEWIGLSLVILGFILLVWDHISCLKR